MARSQDQIMRELDNLIRKPTQQTVQKKRRAASLRSKAQKTAARAEKDKGFKDIRRESQKRGVAFGGFTPAEQGELLSTQFLPRMQAIDAERESAFASLSEVLTNAVREQGLLAAQIRQQELDREAAERAAAAARGGGGGGGGGFGLGDLFGGAFGGATGGAAASNAPSGPEQSAFNDVKARFARDGIGAILSDLRATMDSANRGNLRDQFKINFFKELAPNDNVRNQIENFIARNSNLDRQVRQQGNETIITTLPRF